LAEGSGDSRSGKQGGPAGVDIAKRDTMIEVTPQCAKHTQQNESILLYIRGVWGHAPQEFLKNKPPEIEFGGNLD